MQLLRSQASPDIAALLKRFGEPLREGSAPASGAAKPALAVHQGPVRLLEEAIGAAPQPVAAPAATRFGRSKVLMMALSGIALVPTAILFALWWQDPTGPRADHDVKPAEQATAASPSVPTGSTQGEQASSGLEVVLSSPERIEVNPGEDIDFAIAIDATQALPARSIIAVTALPEGASFSEGRPYGVTGWSLRPDEIGGLRLRLPVRSGASDMRFELISGDGAVLAQSETSLSIALSPAEVATVGSIQVGTPSEVAKAEPAETTGSVDSLPPAPQRKPATPAGADLAVKVTTVKVVPIPAPHPTRAHGGGYALGPASEEQQASDEWVETKSAVDMHAKAQQSSETVKVADRGVKLRVMARDKNWVQVNDPATSTAGWIYNRFLTPAEPLAQ